jgi:NitT/TauT family transport system ATP-binding protein
MKPFVDFRNVWLAYNEQLLAKQQFAVEDISLQIGEGEFVAIVGPSGCGKSTFMKLATGLNRPSRGEVRIDGQNVTGPLKISGMAFQAPSLLPWPENDASPHSLIRSFTNYLISYCALTT